MSKPWRIYESNGKYRIGREGFFWVWWHQVLRQDHRIGDLVVTTNHNEWTDFETDDLDLAKQELYRITNKEKSKPKYWRPI